MSIDKTNNDNNIKSVEIQRNIQETIKTQDLDAIDHPALKRCAETMSLDPEKHARQAYNRMYHTHSRSHNRS